MTTQLRHLLYFLSLVVLAGNAVADDIKSFQLRSEEQCIAPSVLATSEDLPEERPVSRQFCNQGSQFLWEMTDDHRLVTKAYSGDEDGKESFCLTRRHEVSSGKKKLQVYLEPCLPKGNPAQSWAFDKDGKLFEADKAGKAQGAATIPGADNHPAVTDIKGSFQWLKDYPPQFEYCYVIPWNGCRVCGQLMETSSNCPSPEGGGSESPDEPGTGNGDAPPAPEPKPDPKPDPKPKPEPAPTPVPESPENPESVSKVAAFFVLKQLRQDREVCMGFSGDKSEFKVSLEECDPTSGGQQWSHDLATKAIYNKKAGTDMCLTRTLHSISLLRCLDQNQRNSSQRWYFSRGWLPGVPWAVLLSFTINNESWVRLMKDNGFGRYPIRPRYTECQLIQGLCYDLPTGQLQEQVPYYNN